MLIFEGPPDVGKSTIIHMLHSTFPDVKVWPRIGRKLDYCGNNRCAAYYGINLSICNMHLIVKMRVLYDRMHASEYVFGNFLRKDDEEKLQRDFMSVQYAINDVHGTVIYLSGQCDVLLQRQKDRNSEMYQHDSLDTLCNLFGKCYTMTKHFPGVYQIDTNKKTVNDVFDEVVSILKWK